MAEKSKPGWRDVTNALREHQYGKAELLALLADFYKLSAENRDFLHTRFGLDHDSLQPYKKIIKAALCPDLDDDTDVRAAKQAIRRYEQAIGQLEGRLELMFFFVECGHAFVNEYGYTDENFLLALERMFDRIMKLLQEMEPAGRAHYQQRCETIVREVVFVGYGYCDYLADMYREVFPEESANLDAKLKSDFSEGSRAPYLPVKVRRLSD